MTEGQLDPTDDMLAVVCTPLLPGVTALSVGCSPCKVKGTICVLGGCAVASYIGLDTDFCCRYRLGLLPFDAING